LGPSHPGIVLRLPPVEPTFSTYDLLPQALVQEVVAAGGIPAPAPVVVVTDPQWIGTPFLAMPKVSGTIPGPAPLFDEWIVGASPAEQRKVHIGLIDTVAGVHNVEWVVEDLIGHLVGPTVTEALDHWTAYVEWAGDGTPLPALLDALAWCRSRQPEEVDAVLLWGDPRLGNLVFDGERNVHAVLDWDLAALGPHEMDLGWIFGLDFMMGELFGQRVAGFLSKEEAIERYEDMSGHTVANLDWHEVFALVRALAINDRHQRIDAAARAKPLRENPMAEILLARMRAAE
jgi:aminoglycoside phosphotransferase (APT) family kinase protein